MRNVPNIRLLAVYFLATVTFCFGSVAGQEANDYRDVKLSPEESAFLNCSLKCGANVEQVSIFSCLKECQDASKIPPKGVSRLLSIRVGMGVTEDECIEELGKSNFVCPLFSKGCCCEGYFDCKAMETVVKGCVIKSCEANDGREICTCKLN